MILKSSIGYWSTGITVRWSDHVSTIEGQSVPGWYASLDFLDDGFCDDQPDLGEISTEGTLRTRYAVQDGQTVTGLRAAIDALITDANRLGITFGGPSGPPALYYKGDGESADYPPPLGWREMLSAEASRLGWEEIYTASASAQAG